MKAKLLDFLGNHTAILLLVLIGFVVLCILFRDHKPAPTLPTRERTGVVIEDTPTRKKSTQDAIDNVERINKLP